MIIKKNKYLITRKTVKLSPMNKECISIDKSVNKAVNYYEKIKIYLYTQVIHSFINKVIHNKIIKKHPHSRNFKIYSHFPQPISMNKNKKTNLNLLFLLPKRLPLGVPNEVFH